MKQDYLFIISVVIFFTGCIHTENTCKEIHCNYTSTIWDYRSCDWLKADSISFENQQISNNKTTVKTLWNEDSLYICFRVEDRDLRAYQSEKDHPRLFLDDMVEVLIDADNDKGFCWKTDDIVYHINLLGQKKDDRGTPECKSNPAWDGTATYTLRIEGTLNDTTDIDHGYFIKIAFPWTELGLVPITGTKIGVNFANGDNNGKGRQLYDWVGANPMRSPHEFGTLILVKK